jgi:GGDEF domain-containing protein
MISAPFVFTRQASATTLQLGGQAVVLLAFAAVVTAVSHAFLPDDAWLEVSGLVCLAAAAVAFIIKSRARATAPQASVDGERRSWAEIKAAFTQAADSTIADARSRGRAISVAVFRLSDLPELEAVFGTAAAQKIVATLSHALSTVTTGKGMVMRTDVATFAILLPGFQLESALAALKEALGNTLALEVNAGDDEVLLVPDFDARSIGASALAFSELYDNMLRSIEHTRAVEARRMRRLRLEHESYYTNPSVQADPPLAYLQQENTMQHRY